MCVDVVKQISELITLLYFDPLFSCQMMEAVKISWPDCVEQKSKIIVVDDIYLQCSSPIACTCSQFF